MSRETYFASLLKDVTGTYVEIGTCWGGFAEFLLLNTSCTRLVCVDPYTVFPKEVYQDALNYQPQSNLDRKFEIVSKRLTFNSARKDVRMLRTTSYTASKILPNDLSFVYIDGNHHHREVLKDLISWWPKIRKGGYLCGDDVEDKSLHHVDGDAFVQHEGGSFGVYGVATALEDFAKVVPDFQYSLYGNQFIAKKI